MTEMLTRKLTDNRLLAQTAGANLTVSLGSALGEIVSQDMMTGLIGQQFAQTAAMTRGFTVDQRVAFREAEIGRERELAQLTFDLQNNVALTEFERDEMGLRMQEIGQEREAGRNTAIQESIDAGRLQTPEELNAQYADIGLVFDRPTTAEEASLLADGKREEIIRNAIIERSPRGVLAGTAKFGAGLAAMATDPLEIASMFIPVVGQAGKVAAVSRFGRVGGRVAIGATEGLVGSALTEPLYYALSRQQQLDYTMADALLNIGLGAVLGGGIGFAAGTVGRVRGTADPLARVDGELPRVDIDPERVDAPRPTRDMQVNAIERADTALRQFVNGQDVNVRPLVAQVDVPQANGKSMPYDEWSAGNVALDQAGNPTVFYHGAGEAFEAFDASRAGQNFDDAAGVFLTTDKAKAQQYANVAKYKGDGVGAVLDVEASVKNPLIVDSGDVAPDVHWIEQVERGTTPDLEGHDGVIVRANNGEEMAVVLNPDNVRIKNDKPTPAAKADAAATLARAAQEPSPQADVEASRAYDELAKRETTTEAAVREEVEMNERMVDQLELTLEQRAALDEIAEIETKAKAYANLAEVASICMART